MEGLGIRTLPASKFFELANSLDHPLILDVRSPVAVKAHPAPVPALHCNLEDGNFNLMVHSLDKSRPVIVICQDGNRALKACRYLALADFREVWWLQGGLNALEMEKTTDHE